MFGSNVLEVAISIIFVYILLSLLCSTINEQVIVRILSLRAQVLLQGITNMLGDPALVKQFYDHPLIKALSQNMLYVKPAEAQGRANIVIPPSVPARTSVARKPSYIPANIFAIVLKDVLTQPIEATDTTTIAALANLELALKQLNIDLEKDLTGVEVWFNSTMDRVSGWYKRRVQLFIFLLGLIIAFGLNIDTISLVTTVSHDATIRATLVSAAQGYTTQHDPNLNNLEKNIDQLQPLIGWYTIPTDIQGWFLKIIGLLATTFAISLGAPFWFDVLNKFVSFRSSGPPPAPGPGASAANTAPSLQVLVKKDTP